MKETVMFEGSLIADTFERLIEIAGRCDRAVVLRGELSTRPLALWTTEELIAELIKRKELKDEFLKVVKEAIANFIALRYQLSAEVAELAAAIDRAVLQVSRADSKEAADPLPGVMDDDESTSDEGGAP
jgi:hypothetical protein